jgi:hypothetical protein
MLCTYEGSGFEDMAGSLLNRLSPRAMRRDLANALSYRLVEEDGSDDKQEYYSLKDDILGR